MLYNTSLCFPNSKSSPNKSVSSPPDRDGENESAKDTSTIAEEINQIIFRMTIHVQAIRFNVRVPLGRQELAQEVAPPLLSY
jgi:hypothetical protein